MANQQVADLKAKLEKAKDATQTAQVTANALEQKFYDLRVKETEAHLADELVGVCRDYCLKVWTETLNLIEVPAASEWRRAENVYCPEDLQEAPEAPLGPEIDAAPATIALEQLPITQASLPTSETSKMPGRLVTKARGWRWPRAKGLPRVELGQRLKARGLVKVKRSPKLNLC